MDVTDTHSDAPWRRTFPAVATASDVYHCFRLILGRNPNHEEWEGHAANVGRDLTEVVANYVNSLEFDRRGLRAPPRSGRPLIAERDGWRMYADPADDAVGRHVLFGEYEPAVAAQFHEVVKPGMNVVDIGANIGFFTLLAAHLTGPSGQVFAVEPNPANVRLIEASRLLNRFVHVTVWQAAAADRTGLKVLNTFHSNGTTADPSGDPDRLWDATTVACLRLDDVLPGDPVHLVKADVEGAEYTALRGCERMLRRWRPVIVSEFSPGQLPGISGVTGPDYLSWLIALGYRLAILHEAGPPQEAGIDVGLVMAAFANRGADHIDIVARPG